MLRCRSSLLHAMHFRSAGQAAAVARDAIWRVTSGPAPQADIARGVTGSFERVKGGTWSHRWSSYIWNGSRLGEHINNGAIPPPDCLAVSVDRAFSPQSRCCLRSWGVAPGCYRSGLRPSRDCANSSSRPNKKRRRCEPYQPGATPQEETQAQKVQGLKARSILNV